jgi:hypothetical protein
MSVTNNDYNNWSAGGAGCNYSDLMNYTAPYSMGVAPQGKVISGKYLVPTWDAISYDSLVGKSPTCSGYGTITSAYGAGAGNCKTVYSTSLCGSE